LRGIMTGPVCTGCLFVLANHCRFLSPINRSPTFAPRAASSSVLVVAVGQRASRCKKHPEASSTRYTPQKWRPVSSFDLERLECPTTPASSTTVYFFNLHHEIFYFRANSCVFFPSTEQMEMEPAFLSAHFFLSDHSSRVLILLSRRP